MKSMFAVFVAEGACASVAQAVTVGVTPDPGGLGGNWLGFMNVFDLPSNGGAYQFGSPWGVADLNSSWSGNVLKLSPNTIGDPNPYWYTPSGGPGSTGNKIMEANMYREVVGGALAGQTLTFEGTVVSNSFTSQHVARIFIRDWAAGFGSSVDTIITLPTSGNFSISQSLINDPTRIVQWGFQVTGPNVWFTDTAPFGFAEITEVPAPASLALMGLGGLAMARRRRA